MSSNRNQRIVCHYRANCQSQPMTWFNQWNDTIDIDIFIKSIDKYFRFNDLSAIENNPRFVNLSPLNPNEFPNDTSSSNGKFCERQYSVLSVILSQCSMFSTLSCFARFMMWCIPSSSIELDRKASSVKLRIISDLVNATVEVLRALKYKELMFGK